VSHALIPAIHACRKHVAGLAEDDAWRPFLERVTGKTSLRACDGRQLGKVLDELHRLGAPKRPGAGARGATSDDRPQARMARGLWIELGKAGVVRDPSEAGLNRFCETVTRKAAMRFCTPAELNKLVEALKGWRDRTDAQDPVVRIAEAMEVHPTETRDQALIRHLWGALRDAGALRYQAGLDAWLLPRFGVSNAAALDEAQAEAAVKQLGEWLRGHLRRQGT
jgi:hypothetical protein